MMIKVLANTDLGKELTSEQFEGVLDWLRSNGVDPGEAPASYEVVIYNDASRAKIDCWLRLTADTPAGTKTLSIESVDPDHSLRHVEVPIVRPLPDDLAERLVAIWKARIESGAQAAAVFAAAEYRAKAAM